MTDSPIDELFLRFHKTRNADDLGRVFDLAAPELMSMGRRSGLEPAAQEDALQETFLTVLRRIEDFRVGERFMPWAQGIMARQIQSERRKVWRLLGALGLDELPPVPHSEPGPGQLMEDSELRARVEEALERVSATSQSVLRGTLLDGASPAELAQELGITSNAVSVRVHRGLEQIRAYLPASTLAGLAASLLYRQRGLAAVRETVGSTLKGTGAGSSLFGPVGWWIAGSGVAAATILAVSAALRTPAAETVEVRPGSADPVAVERSTEVDPVSDTNSREAAIVASLKVGEAAIETPTQPAAEPGPLPRTIQLLEPGGATAPAGIDVFALATTPEPQLPTAETANPMGLTDENGRVPWLSSAAQGDPTPLFYARSDRWAGHLAVKETSEANEFALQLEPCLTLDVTVIEPDGTPVDGAEVSLLSLHPHLFVMGNPHALERGFFSPEPYRYLFGGVTDVNGKCTIYGFLTDFVNGRPAGTVTAIKDGHAAFPLRFYWDEDDQRHTLELVAPRVDELELLGRTLDESGAPLEGVRLKVLFRGNETDEGTELAVTGPSGQWEIEPRYLDRFPMVVAFEKDGHVTSHMRVSEPEQIKGKLLDVRLRRHVPLVGRIENANGDPVVAKVRLISGGAVIETQSGEDGGFRFAGVPAGRGTLLATSLHEPSASAAVKFQDHDEPVSVRLAPATPAACSVQFRLATQDPDAHGQIERLALIPRYTGALGVRPAADGDAPELPLTQWPFVEVVCEDPASEKSGEAPPGTAVTHQVPPGEWTVLAIARNDGQRRHLIQNITLVPSEELQVIGLAAQETGSLKAIVNLQDGMDLVGAQVTATRLDNPTPPLWFQLTNEYQSHEIQSSLEPDGTFQTSRLLPGTWSIRAAGDGWASRIERVEVLPGMRAQVDLIPELAGTMKLRLPAITGPGRFTVEISPTAEGPFTAVSMPRFLVPMETLVPVSLPPGKWYWRVHCNVFPDDTTIGIAIPSAQGSRRMRAKRATTISPFKAKRRR